MPEESSSTPRYGGVGAISGAGLRASQGMKSVRESGSVFMAIEVLTKNVEELELAIATHAERISPVLCPASPTDRNEKEGGSPVQIADRILSINSRILAATRMLRDTTSRVDL